MKLLIFIATLCISVQALAAESGKPDVYTTRLVHVKPEVTFDQAKQSFDALNVVLAKLKGFKKRNVFYDKEQKVWIDQIKWKHIEAAKAGEKTLTNDPAYANLAKILDAKATTHYQAERVAEYDAPK